ncbi:site-specific recombinase XerD [Burkholderiales bacterium JOSHI_001]|nr:site-specific recombinase XerD [Burkholderiales bacterium JOSHI_001]
MGRKGSGVEVRGNAIRVQFSLDGQVLRRTLNLDGKPLPPTASNLKYAHRLAAEIRERIRFGTFSLSEYFPSDGDVGQPLTVGTQLDDWLAAQRLEVSTSAGYASAIRFWKQAICDRHGTALGDRPVRALKHSDVLTALASRPDLTGKTVNNYVSVLRGAMDLAASDKVIATNPVNSVARAKHQKPLPDPFSRDEVESIVQDMKAHYPAPIGNYIEFKFFTGLRTSESFGLQWADMDLAGKHMLIHRAIVRGVEKNNTKTNVARKVALNSRAMAALQRQRAHTQIRNEHVFLDPRYDLPWLEERAFRRSFWEPTLRRLGMRYRPPYNTRHSYATMMLMAGMRPAYCAKQLGHSVEMFLRTYAKWLDGDHDALEMNRLEAALAPVLSQIYPKER